MTTDDVAGPLKDAIERRAALWKSLRERMIVVSTSRSGERAFHRAADVAGEAKRLADAAVEPATLDALAASLEQNPPARACVIDALCAAALVKEQPLSPAEAILRARVRYQGTDGVRGKVAADVADEPPLRALVERGEFTPGVAELLAAGVMVARGGGEPPKVVLLEDGRDAFGERRTARAVGRAFLRYGCKVLDLGVAPTPLGPVAAASLGAEIAAVVTASHNPADQNGIKFYLGGRKPLPETGDYPLSAATFVAALEGMPKEKNDQPDKVDARAILREFFRQAVAPEDVEALRGARLVVDVAHGAFAPFAGEVLAGFGLSGEVINVHQTGDNINRDSGVAYIEARERVKGADVDGEIALVGRVRHAAREHAEPVFGIALDGDGDRGFVLVYDAKADEVRILDGDRLAFLMARLAREKGGGAPGVFAGTVESDLAVFDAVERMKMETLLTPVGDKWLSARRELTEKLFLGEEPSGHIVWPAEIAFGERRETIVTGNGLLTALRGAAAAVRLGLKPAQAAEPYAPGVFRTFHAYYTDRERFHRGSAVWREDVRIVEAEVERLKGVDKLPAKCRLREVDFEDDPDMLYLRLATNGHALGAVFARNSGTENKTATYARGLAEHAEALVALARAMNEHHLRTMKDPRFAEAGAGVALAEALAAKGRLTLDAARKVVREHGIDAEAGFVGLLFALGREERLRRVGDDIVAPNGH